MSFFQKWDQWIPISSVNTLMFNTVLDLPLDDDKLAAVKVCAMKVGIVTSERCKNTLDMFQRLKAFCNCFPSFRAMKVTGCTSSFSKYTRRKRNGFRELSVGRIECWRSFKY